MERRRCTTFEKHYNAYKKSSKKRKTRVVAVIQLSFIRIINVYVIAISNNSRSRIHHVHIGVIFILIVSIGFLFLFMQTTWRFFFHYNNGKCMFQVGQQHNYITDIYGHYNFNILILIFVSISKQLTFMVNKLKKDDL